MTAPPADPQGTKLDNLMPCPFCTAQPVQREGIEGHTLLHCPTLGCPASVTGVVASIFKARDIWNSRREPCACPDHPRHLLIRINGEAVLRPYHEVVAMEKAIGAKMVTGTITPAPAAPTPALDRELRNLVEASRALGGLVDQRKFAPGAAKWHTVERFRAALADAEQNLRALKGTP